MRPKTAREYNQLGSKLLKNGRFNEAIQAYSQCVIRCPYDYVYLYNRGYSLFRVERLDESERDLTISLLLQPNYINAVITLGHIQSSKHNYEKSLEYYSQAKDISPNNSFVYSSRGSVFATMHQYDKAIEDFKESIKIDPTNDDPIYRLGLINLTKYNYVEAEKYFRKGLQISKTIPYRSGFYGKLALVYVGLKKFKEALEYSQTALDFNTIETNPLAHYSFSRIYLKTGDFQQALKYINLSIDAETTVYGNPRYYCQRARIYRKLKEYDKAIKDCDEASKTNKYAANGFYILGKIFHDLGKFQKAEETFNQAITVNHVKFNYYRERGKNYRLSPKRDLKKSKSDLLKALELPGGNKNGKLYLELCKTLIMLISNPPKGEEGDSSLHPKKLEKLAEDHFKTARRLNKKYSNLKFSKLLKA